MQIVTDAGADLAEEQSKSFKLHRVPLRIIFKGKTYISGIDIQADEFYKMLSESDEFPTTSQPSAGEFADLYRELAKTDPDILSVHISSGLSGTINAAKAGALMVPEARITFWDTKTLSCPEGWQVEAAAKGVHEGLNVDQILEKLDKIRQACEGMFTLPQLKYLIHGGRISHIKGLVASLLQIKPIISVDKNEGIYVTQGQEMTFTKAIRHMVDYVARRYGEGARLRIQPLHANCLEGVETLKKLLAERFTCIFDPVTPIAPVLGAHTGPGLVGMAVGPAEVFGL